MTLLICIKYLLKHLALEKAGNYVKEQILSGFIRLIASSPEHQTYSVQKLYASLRSDISQEALTLAGSWVIGEFGDLLLAGGAYEEEELVQNVKESDVVDLLATILNSAYATKIVCEYVATSLMKLTTRISDAGQIERIRRIMMSNADSLDVEIQQRSVEYGSLFGYDSVRRGVLEKMPVPEARSIEKFLDEGIISRKKEKIVKAPEKKSDAMDVSCLSLYMLGFILTKV